MATIKGGSSLCSLLLLVLLVGGVVGSPMFKGEEEEAPGYEINPHFGFRKYFEIRYEPISEPYVGYQPVDNIQQNYHQQDMQGGSY